MCIAHIEYLCAGGQNQKWPTSGPSGYITPAVWGSPDASEWGTKSEVAQKWPKSSEQRQGARRDTVERRGRLPCQGAGL